jgi:ribose-phosphate pyrophosphokinase
MARNKLTVVGFKDEAALVWSLAKRMSFEPQLVRESSYPAGELAIQVPAKVEKQALLIANIREQPSSLVRALIAVEGLRAAGAKHVTLLAPWIAYGRQDRMAQPGEAPAGNAVARALRNAVHRILTLDAHSPVFVKAFGPVLRNLSPAAAVAKMLEDVDAVAAPDVGAKVRAGAVAKLAKLPVVPLEKTRVGPRVSVRPTVRVDLRGKRVLLVDDIVDSGGTLLMAARTLRDLGASRVSAFVSHAADLEASRRRLATELEELDAAFDHAKLQLASWAADLLADAV